MREPGLPVKDVLHAPQPREHRSPRQSELQLDKQLGSVRGRGADSGGSYGTALASRSRWSGGVGDEAAREDGQQIINKTSAEQRGATTSSQGVCASVCAMLSE